MKVNFTTKAPNISGKVAVCVRFTGSNNRNYRVIKVERTAKLKADVPQLEAIVAKSWGKEEELKGLKSELAALDRKITAELAPKHDEKDGEEVKRDDQPQLSHKVEDPTKSADSKESMVAEPIINYRFGASVHM